MAGVVGYNALPYFCRRYPGRVIGVRPVSNWRLNGPFIEACDLERQDDVQALFKRFAFRSVLDCGGNCALKSCELDPRMARAVNVIACENIVRAAPDARIVRLSSDLVFSGERDGGYRESDPPDPVTIYGRTMVEAEEIVRGRSTNSIVARISLPMGPTFNGHAGAIDWIRSRFRANRPATLYYDEIRSPTYVRDLNLALESLLVGDQTGLLHLAGPRHLSLYQIGQIVNRVGGYLPDLLKGCLRVEAGPMPPRAGNVTLSCSWRNQVPANILLNPWPFSNDLVPNDRQWHFQRNCELWDGDQASAIANHLYDYPFDVGERALRYGA